MAGAHVGRHGTKGGTGSRVARVATFRSLSAPSQHTVLLSTDYTSVAEGDMGDRRDRHLRVSVGDTSVDSWSRQASSITGFGHDLDGRPDFSCLLRVSGSLRGAGRLGCGGGAFW